MTGRRAAWLSAALFLAFAACHGGPRGEDGPAIATGTNVREIVPICSIVARSAGDNPSEGRVTCSAGLSTSKGDVPIAEVGPDLSLQWQAPEAVEGTEAKDIACSLVGELRQDCTIKLDTATAHIRFTLSAENVFTKEKATSSRVVYVYSTWHAYGATPDIPMRFRAGASSTGGTRAARRAVRAAVVTEDTPSFGTIPLEMPLGSAPFAFNPTSGTAICGLTDSGGGEQIFVTGLASVYVIRGDKVTLFAGSSVFVESPPGEVSSPLSLHFGYPVQIACDDARHTLYAVFPGLQVFEHDYRRLKVARIELTPSGDVKSTTVFAAPEVSAGYLAGAAVGPDGSLFVFDGNRGIVTRMSPTGAFSEYARVFTAPIVCARLEGTFETHYCEESRGAIAADAAGNLYVVSSGHHRVYRVAWRGGATAGPVSVFAGTGQVQSGPMPCDQGNDVPATSTSLYHPLGIAVRGSDVFIADRKNERVRRVDSRGIITTYAGCGTVFLGAAAPSIALPAVEFGADAARAAAGQWQDPVTLGMTSRFGLLVGLSNFVLAALGPPRAPERALVVASSESPYVKDGDLLEPHPGATQGGKADPLWWRKPYFGPLYRVDHDAAGNVLLLEVSPGRVLRIEPGPGNERVIRQLTTSAGNPIWRPNTPDAKQPLGQPRGMAVGPDGSIFIADTGHHRIRKLANGVLTTIAGSTPALDERGTMNATYKEGAPFADTAELHGPFGVAAGANGHVYVADRLNHVIRELVPDAKSGKYTISTIAGVPRVAGETTPADGAVARATPINIPPYVAVDDKGLVYFSTLLRDADGVSRVRLYRIEADGSLRIVAGGGTQTSAGFYPDARALLLSPSGITAGPHGTLLVIDGGSRVIQLSPTDGGGMSARFLFGRPSQPNGLCATGINKGVGTASADDGLLTADIGALCMGVITSLDLLDTCGTPGGKYLLRFTQIFGMGTGNGQLVEAEFGCAP